MLKSLDFLSYHPNISITGTNGYRTLVGSFLSVLIAILTLLCTIGFGEDIIFRNKPSSFVTEVFDASPKLESSKVLVAIAPGLLGGAAIPNVSSYIEIKFGSVDTINQINGSNVYNFYTPPKCIDSERYTSDPILNVTKTLYPSDQYVCPPLELLNFEIEGVYGSNSRFKAFDIRILPCQNTTVNVCKSPEEIKSMLKLFYIGLIVQTNIINPVNYSSPITNQYYTSLIRLTSYGSRQESIHLRLIDFYSDSGFILSSVTQDSTFMYDHSLSDSIYEPNPSFYLRMLVSCHSVRSQLFREYLKIQKVAADVGGIVKFIMIIASFINSLYANESLNVNILKNLLGYSKLDTQILNHETKDTSAARISQQTKKQIGTDFSTSRNRAIGTQEPKKLISVISNNFVVNQKSILHYRSKYLTY